MNILHAASEVYPLISTGGLSSVVAALPSALNSLDGVTACVIIPYYGELVKSKIEIKWLGHQETFLGEGFGLAKTIIDGLTVFLVAKEEYFSRDGIYGESAESSWPDNPARFSFFSRAVASLTSLGGFVPDIIHCHDWQASLIPVYLRDVDIPTVLTIHNLQFQGRYHHAEFLATFLPDTLYNINGLEFWSDWNSLKGGIVFSDQITTVSPTYAEEIRTEQFGNGLNGVLEENKSKLTGILNGIDMLLWNPEIDTKISRNYGIGKMRGKSECKKNLCSELGLKPSTKAPLIGMVTRLTDQKGIDLVIDNVSWLMKKEISLVILGTGEKWAEDSLLELSRKYPDRLSVTIGYNDKLARKIFSASDVFLMPSVFEPCGLGQMMAMRYGSVPLVRNVGGLSDSVTEKTGFLFSGETKEFQKKVEELLVSWSNKKSWAWIRRRCMNEDFSWGGRLDDYMSVYKKAMESHK